MFLKIHHNGRPLFLNVECITSIQPNANSYAFIKYKSVNNHLPVIKTITADETFRKIEQLLTDNKVVIE